VTNLTKARLITVLLIASLFASSLAWFGHIGGYGMCDGGGLF
jgi:hypothetical protein